MFGTKLHGVLKSRQLFPILIAVVICVSLIFYITNTNLLVNGVDGFKKWTDGLLKHATLNTSAESRAINDPLAVGLLFDPSIKTLLSFYEKMKSDLDPQSNILVLPNGRLQKFRQYEGGSLTIKDTIEQAQSKPFGKVIVPGNKQLGQECRGKIKQWAVITSIAEKPTETMIKLLNVSLSSNNTHEQWCLVIILDEKNAGTFNSASLTAAMKSRTVILNLNDQTALPFKTVKLTPKNTFSRKNIGYLFAMHCGADVIFDLDDDNIPVSVSGIGTRSNFIPVLTKSEFKRDPLSNQDLDFTVQ
jgi:hypothetical protein